MSRDGGIKLLSIYHVMMAGLLLLAALATVLIPLESLRMSSAPPQHLVALVVILGLLFAFLGAMALYYLIIGVALWRRKEWARWMAIALGVLGLIVFPVGTVTGGLILWFLSREDVQEYFQGGE